MAIQCDCLVTRHMLYHLLLLFFACVSLLRPPGAWDIHPLAMSGTQSIREALRVQTVRLVTFLVTPACACRFWCDQGIWNVLPEQGEVAAPHSLSQFVVGLQGLSQARLGEVLVLRDLTQQQAHQDQPLADCHSEAQSAVGCLQATEEKAAQLHVTTSSRCTDCLHFSLGCAGADVGLSVR